MQTNLKTLFQERVVQCKTEATQYSRKNDQIAIVRVLFFLVSIIGLIYFANERNVVAVAVIIVIFLIGFSIIVKYHNSIKIKKTHLDNLIQINEEEIQRLSGDLNEFDAGTKYLETTHPYAADLDVCGKHSLFQLINRSNTEKGKEKLADWLKNAAKKQTIEARQEAVIELKEKLDWRQDFQAYGKEKPASQKAMREEVDEIKVLLNWIQEPDALKNHGRYKLALLILPILTLIAIALYFITNISGYYSIGLIAINSFILWTTKDTATTTHKKTSKSISILKAYRMMILKIEQSTFKAELLKRLQVNFKHKNYTASEEINSLQNILDNLDNRANVFYHLANVIMLLDIYWLLKADRWKAKNREDVSVWFADISEFEALNGLAGFSFAHSEFVFPIIDDKPFTYQATALGHCLIKLKNRVVNDYELAGKGAIAIITGSNMSGKSTFLRTVGINAVLALAGAPVCAQEMKISKMQVFTSMRTQDSLEESVSSFYAELRRLKQLLETVAEGQPVLFMLDEILKGTNSHDRHNGAASLIRQLSKLNATGLVSTHDLELGELESQLPNVKNYSFNSQIEGDEISFDYKLHEGVCKSFNASKLMEKMGIAMNEENRV